jgi:hypothetical protein
MDIDPARLAELDFLSVKDWEVEHIWSHEFTALAPDLVRLTRAWRAQVPRKKGQRRFEAYLSHQGGRVTPFIQIGDQVFWIPLGAYYLFPEWPGHYLKIPSEVRFRRFKKLWKHEKDWLEPQEEEEHADGPSGQKKQKRAPARRKRGAVAMELREIDPHPAEYRLDPIIDVQLPQQVSVTRWDGDALNRFMESLMQNIRLSNKMRVFRSDAEELAILRVSWGRSDKHNLDLFSKWLTANRPTAFQRQGTTGRSHPLPKKVTELGYLRKYLIVQDTGTWNVRVGQMPLFRDRSKWNYCRKAVEKILACLHPVPIAPV